MKAAVHTRYGPPEVVRVSEVEMPTIKDDEVLVKVHATTVNRTDCGFRAAEPFIVRFFAAGQKVGNVVISVERSLCQCRLEAKLLEGVR
jgi:NADPH:quinone reductase-like Zn-dependent oxidoreductase